MPNNKYLDENGLNYYTHQMGLVIDKKIEEAGGGGSASAIYIDATDSSLTIEAITQAGGRLEFDTGIQGSEPPTAFAETIIEAFEAISAGTKCSILIKVVNKSIDSTEYTCNLSAVEASAGSPYIFLNFFYRPYEEDERDITLEVQKYENEGTTGYTIAIGTDLREASDSHNGLMPAQAYADLYNVIDQVGNISTVLDTLNGEVV